MTDDTLKAGLPATTNPATRLLVLGSLPGDRSLARQEYYAGRGNQFWRLIGPVIDADIHALAYGEKVKRLLAAGIGLWDVIRAARRTGSLDSRITDHRANDLRDFVGRLPRLRAIGFNGRTAATLGRRQLGAGTTLALFDLPSSSAAYCRMSLDAKQAQWLALRAHLGSK